MHRVNLKAIATLIAMIATMPLTVWAGTDAEEQAWVKAMTPGERHARLADKAGEWRAVVTIWNEPGAEPTTLEGVATKTMVMGGRYLEEEFSGEFMGRPFRGVGISGYDNITKEYVAVWYDNMSTGLHLSTGRDDGKGGQTYTATQHDPAGRTIQSRSTSRVIDRDHHVFESYNALEDGTEFLHMRVEYTRASY